MLLYENRMLIFGFGSNLIMTDLNASDSIPQNGLWKGFMSVLHPSTERKRQSVLKGHIQKITQIEVF